MTHGRITSRRVVTPEGVRPASIVVSGGRIQAVEPPGVPAHPEGSSETAEIDVGDAVVFPGLVDPHVHINDPGRSHWEGFESATRAAAAGGITTLVDMPLNSSPVTTSTAALRQKAAAAEGRCHVDVGFWGGLIPGNTDELAGLLEAGVLGLKCFLSPSGIDEFPPVTEAELTAALPILAQADAVLLVHAESPGTLAAARLSSTADPRRYARYLASRPQQAEEEAIELMIRLSEETGTRVHIVHLSAAHALGSLAAARARGLALTVETCPHYLCLEAEAVPDGATAFKCAPPVRERDNRERLWKGLADGVIDFVASDHSPCPPELKELESGHFLRAWGGIASLELSLPIVWTEARRRGFGLRQVAEWMCAAPARFARLSCKGAIAPGRDADLVVWRPEETLSVDPARLEQRHKITPYAGQDLEGVVEHTFLRGELVFDRGTFPGAARGRWLKGV